MLSLWVMIIVLSFGCAPKKETNSKSEQTPSVYFVNLKEGDTVKNPVTVKFGVKGMSVASAGQAPSKNTGHHHLIIDGKTIPYGQLVPMDEKHLHFMKGETEHTLELKPGKHTLTLQFAGTDHRSFGKPLSASINVTVTGAVSKTAQKTDPHAHHKQAKHAGHGSHGKTPSAAQGKLEKGAKRIYFRAPLDGQTVPTSLSVLFGADGFKVTPAGQQIDSQDHGHHHLVIDGKPIPKGTVVPSDKTHIHFGKGQEKTRILLDEGPHTLTLQFADGAHRSFGPEYSQTIKVIAKPMHVFFRSPPDNSTISQDATILFGAEGVTVTPAGQHISDTTKGHHHLIIDGKPLDRGVVVPSDAQHIHFGKGQTEVKLADLKVKPGKHTFTLQFADGAHRSLGPEMSKTINIEIK